MHILPDKDEAERLREIVHVLFDNHLGHVIAGLGLRHKLMLSRRLKGTDKYNELTPEVLLKVIEDLDGSFIKLGQLLSMRPDLIPQEFCDVLTSLQDKVRPFDSDTAVKIIEKELKKPIKKLFKSFDHVPIAAASMGQVHKAVLNNNTKVAVKVQRPDIIKRIKIDIKLLYRLASMIKKRFDPEIFDPVAIIQEFERYTDNELNYLKEAHNIDIFHKNLVSSKTVKIPKVIWPHTTSRVLTMELMTGQRLDPSKIEPKKRRELMKNILECEFEQIFVHGFFHADPHPGNFLVKKDCSFALLDFGIVGRLDFSLKEHVTDYFINVIDGDIEGMANEIMEMGMYTEKTKMESVKQDIYERLSGYYSTSVDKIKMSDALNDVIRIFRENQLRISPNFVLLTKATITLEGLANMLYPKMDFISTARPFARKLARERLMPENLKIRAKKKIAALMDFTSSLPEKTSTFLHELHDTSSDLKRIDHELSNLALELDRSSNRVVLGFLSGTLFIASTLVIPFQKTFAFGLPIVSLAGYSLALAIIISLFISILREKRI